MKHDLEQKIIDHSYDELEEMERERKLRAEQRGFRREVKTTLGHNIEVPNELDETSMPSTVRPEAEIVHEPEHKNCTPPEKPIEVSQETTKREEDKVEAIADSDNGGNGSKNKNGEATTSPKLEPNGTALDEIEVVEIDTNLTPTMTHGIAIPSSAKTELNGDKTKANGNGWAVGDNGGQNVIIQFEPKDTTKVGSKISSKNGNGGKLTDNNVGENDDTSIHVVLSKPFLVYRSDVDYQTCGEFRNWRRLGKLEVRPLEMGECVDDKRCKRTGRRGTISFSYGGYKKEKKIDGPWCRDDDEVQEWATNHLRSITHYRRSGRVYERRNVLVPRLDVDYWTCGEFRNWRRLGKLEVRPLNEDESIHDKRWKRVGRRCTISFSFDGSFNGNGKNRIDSPLCCDDNELNNWLFEYLKNAHYRRKDSKVKVSHGNVEFSQRASQAKNTEQSKTITAENNVSAKNTLILPKTLIPPKSILPVTEPQMMAETPKKKDTDLEELEKLM